MNSFKNFFPKKSCSGFTLMELMVVVILVGIIAAFAIPNYTKSIERSHEKDAISNLVLISGAQEAYRAQYGNYWPVGGGNQGLALVNANLGLNIVNQNMNYVCAQSIPIPPPWYECFAIRQGGTGWQVYIDPSKQGVPCCDKWTAALCPTLAKCP